MIEEKLTEMRDMVTRTSSFKEVPSKISVFIGMRRTGKTVFLFQKIQELLQQGITLSQILYINFEDDRLQAQNNSMLVDLLDSFYRLYPENHSRHCYLCFDEIQNVPDWPIVIRRLFDSKKGSVYLTGSSAKLLSTEIATSLRGRSLSTEIWPFSFNEWLLAQKIEPFPKVMGKKTADQYNKKLKNYLEFGGFPETNAATKDIQHRILQEYVNVVIMRDIIERHHITNVTLIRYMIKSLIKNVGSPFSINKFFNDIKSQGIPASRNTLYEYQQYIEDAYLLFAVPIYSESIRKIQSNPKKIYAIDTGLIGAYTLSRSSNFGHLFENLIYIDLRRKNHQIYYYLTKEGYEIDFVSRSPDGILHISQVVWDIKDSVTLQREQRALEAAEMELGVKGHLITPENYLSFVTCSHR